MFSQTIFSKSDLLRFQYFLVLGGGISGESAGQLLKLHGKTVFLADKLAQKKEDSPFAEVFPDHEVPRAFLKSQAIIKSPGISPEHPILLEATKRSIPILSEIYLGRLFYNGTLIGITGTDGKSTTTALTHHLIKVKYSKSEVGGNLGLPFTSFCEKNLDVVVLELSSYQLEDSPNLKLKSSAIITLAPDHLERHKTMERYALAKWKIVSHSDASHTMITQSKVLDLIPKEREPFLGKTLFFGNEGEIRIDSKLQKIYTQNGIYETVDFPLPGNHNLQNLSVAIGLAESIGLTESEIQSAIPTFTGLPHRFQRIPESDYHFSKYPNLVFINDSKSTNFHSMLSGISGFSRSDNLFLILGGDPKIESLDPFFQRLKELRACVFVYGKAADIWKSEFQKAELADCYFVKTIEEAIKQIKSKLDTSINTKVILSPAAASFDQYKNFSERGEHFVSLVKQYFGEE